VQWQIDLSLCENVVMQFRRLFLALALYSAVSACGGGSGASAPPPPVAVTNSASLTWTVPVENADGSALTNLSGFYIYHGASPASLDTVITVSSPGISSYTVDNLGKGTHYFSVSAFNSGGAESDRSIIGSKTIP
jgi:hypothetical protein